MKCSEGFVTGRMPCNGVLSAVSYCVRSVLNTTLQGCCTSHQLLVSLHINEALLMGRDSPSFKALTVLATYQGTLSRQMLETYIEIGYLPDPVSQITRFVSRIASDILLSPISGIREHSRHTFVTYACLPQDLFEAARHGVDSDAWLWVRAADHLMSPTYEAPLSTSDTGMNRRTVCTSTLL